MIPTMASTAAMILIDAAAIVALSRCQRFLTRAAVVASLPLAALVLAIALGEDAFGVMRLFAYGLFIHLPIVLLVGAAVVARRSWPHALLALSAALAITGVGVDAFWIEPTRLETTRLLFTTDKVSQPVRIALVADIQTDHVGDYERDALAQVVAANPDLVLFVGDYVQTHDPDARPRLVAQLNALLLEQNAHPPLGAVAVQGNVDLVDWTEIFDGMLVDVVESTRPIDMGEIVVTALSESDSCDVALSVSGVKEQRYHIVVGHHPDFALGDVDADLLVAGHTHGGQVRLPGLGPLLTASRIPRSWAAGVTQLDDDTRLIVSRGIGHERGHAPRLRFLCRPEIVILELVPSAGRKGADGEGSDEAADRRDAHGGGDRAHQK